MISIRVDCFPGRWAVAALSCMSLSAGCSRQPGEPAPVIHTPSDLVAHGAEFERRVEKVTDGVYVAIGFGLANSVLLEGRDGVIIVDTMESIEEAETVLTAFREITDKPVRALIYTHNHTDHIMGSRAFSRDPDLPVYAHSSTAHYIDRIINTLRPVITRRSMRMFGVYLDDSGLINAGIGPYLGLGPDSTIGLLRPNRTFDDTLEDEIAGIRFRLEHAPGETNDQILVWLPEKRVLLPGDNVYKSFPNLYTIRGTPYRDMLGWVASIDRIREIAPDHLVPGHTSPISGTQNIQQVLTDYRDAIQFVHDQAIRGINLGLTPDELVETIRLPEHLAASPYLQEFYGTVAWSVRSVFDGNLGWFDGNPASLSPLPPDTRAEHIASLAGGFEPLMQHAAQALARGDYQWALELSDQLLRLKPGNRETRDLRVAALRALGESQSNPNARHYYLTVAREFADGLEIAPLANVDNATLHSFPLDSYFRNMAVNLDPHRSADTITQVQFFFPDAAETWSVLLRRGVAEIRAAPIPDPDIRVVVDSRIWKEMLAGKRNAATTVATGMEIEGGSVAFLRFLALFRPVP